jgi:hypothetical protein
MDIFLSYHSADHQVVESIARKRRDESLEPFSRPLANQKALDAYQEGLTIAKGLADQDKSNAGWQRDLSVSLQQGWRRPRGAGQTTGNARRLPGRLDDRQTPSDQDKSNAGWQRDLSLKL